MAARWATDLLGALGSALLPPLCPLCLARAPEGPPGLFCSPCRGRLRPLAEPWCPLCSLPFPGVGPSHPCPRCSAEPPPFRRLAAWGPYEGALLEAVRGFKYSGRLHLVQGLQQLLVEAFDRAGLGQVPGLECAVPVPCSAQSLRRRGFDLPALLARSLARSRGLRWRPTALAKVAETPDLVGLGAEERRRAVSRAYRPREALSGAVVLVDDVATSTATARTCARACLRAGAGEVWVVTLARTALVS